MSHYEERLQSDLEAIRASVKAVGKQVRLSVDEACKALLALDRTRASANILGDLPINRAIRAIDKNCHFFVARHLPSAGILRFVSSVLRLTIAIERIGDYAATISRETIQLQEPVSQTVGRDVELMGEQSLRMLKQALKAFGEGNAELARGTMGMAAQVDCSFKRVFADLLREGEKRSRSIADVFAILTVFNRLERISDQAKNICEEAIFAATGVTKEPKRYRILFVDPENACWSPLAEAIARKAFPESGQYASAGWAPAAAMDAGFLDFMDRHGLEVRQESPRPIPTTHEELDDYHVIVNLGRELRSHLADLPFKTVLLDWDLIPPDGEHDGGTPGSGTFGSGTFGSGAPGAEGPDFERLYKQIAFQIRELMLILRGADAA